MIVTLQNICGMNNGRRKEYYFIQTAQNMELQPERQES